MKKVNLSLLEVSLLAGTRVALGAGAGLLLSDSLDNRQRRALGWGLFMVGAATTIPLVRRVLGPPLSGLPPVVEK
ncbi:hypothetical protein [Geobacter sp. DSM 9736]|uniref:hypothetical protein n=1 Tax=Geobacter sp. DSM 9736 TaxID=1277350 RepID=UPI000B50E09B|nr:hypothetical protein [Geobacter sp. DSM 9736]SNB47736.1 hypothetical protein SAMN06269301_3228 [Geobacter sp. DSM 9736]